MPERDSLLREISQRFRRKEGFALATLNLNHVVQLRSSEAFRQACRAHDLTVADGNPVVWLSKMAGRPVSLVTGSDLLRPLLRLAAAEAAPVAFYGADLQTLRAAKTVLEQEISGLDICWIGAPPMGFDPTSEAAKEDLARMQASGAQLCILALSAPRQEIFGAFGRAQTRGIGFCSLGASLEFVIGKQTRAPLWVRKLALEWLWRAGSAPKRLGPRYAACLATLPRLIQSSLQQR